MTNTVTPRIRLGFTLVELLTAIAVMGVLAALTVPVLFSVQRTAKIAVARTEMAQIETALDTYRAQFGFYPPSNGAGPAGALYNQLYYELCGATNIASDSGPCYQVLHSTSVVGVQFYQHLFNVGGIVNCAKDAGEDSAQARSFLSLKPSEIGALPITNNYGGYTVNFLVTSLGGPDERYQPMGFPRMNPFRYLGPRAAKHKAIGYDLWIQLVIGGRTNLVCNWSKKVMLNNPLP